VGEASRAALRIASSVLHEHGAHILGGDTQRGGVGLPAADGLRVEMLGALPDCSTYLFNGHRTFPFLLGVPSHHTHQNMASGFLEATAAIAFNLSERFSPEAVRRFNLSTSL